MVNKLCLLVATFFTALSISAQITESKTVKVDWGNEVKKPKKVGLSHIIGSNSDSFYGIVTESSIFTSRIKKMTLKRYAKNSQILNSQELTLESNGVECNYSDFIMVNGKLLLFTSFKNEKLNEKTLFVQEINKISLLPVGELSPIASVSIKNQFELFKNLKRSFVDNNYWNYVDRDILSRSKLNPEQFFGIKLSQDSSKAIVVYKVLNPDDESEVIGLNVYDSNFKSIWSKDVNIVFPDKEFVAQNYEIDNDGNAYVLGRLYNDKKKERVKGEVNYNYLLLQYNSEGKLINEYPLEVSNKYIEDMKLKINHDNQLVVAGFYANEYNVGIQGSFYNRINLITGEIEVSNTKEFSVDLLTENFNERDTKRVNKRIAKGKEFGLKNYVIDDIYEKNDGTIALVAEQAFITVQRTTDSKGNVSTYYLYHNNDILVINMNQKSGEILWATKINKLQRTLVSNAYSSYSLSVLGNKMYFIFNDNLENFKPNKDRDNVFTGAKNSVTTVSELDADGNYDYNLLFVPKGKQIYFKPSVSQMLSPNELIIYNWGRKTHMFATVKFGDDRF